MAATPTDAVASCGSHEHRSAPPRPGQRRAVPVLVRRRRRAGLQRDPRAHRSRATSASSAAATRACGRRSCQGARPVPRRRAPRGAPPSAGARRAATAGSWSRASPTAWRTARSGSRTSWPPSSGSGLQTLDDIEAAIDHYAHRLRLRAHGRHRHRHRAAPARRAAARTIEQLAALGQDVELLDEAAMRAQVDSPTYLGGLWRKDRAAIVDPARLAWGLKAAAEGLGVRIYEDTKATEAGARRRRHARPRRRYAKVRAGHVALGTNAFPPLLRRMRHYIVPVYDYAMVTEPLTRRAAGCDRLVEPPGPVRLRQPVPLLPAHRGQPHPVGRLRRRLLLRRQGEPGARAPPETFARLSEHFFATFPQLEGLEFSHVWGGAIDTCTRYCVFWDTAMQGRVAYAAGYTGLGVCSTRFGAEVLVDLLDGRRTERTGLDFVRKRAAAVPARAGQVPRASSSRAGRSTAPTAAAATATSGCAPSTGWASASTAEVRGTLARILPATRRRTAAPAACPPRPRRSPRSPAPSPSTSTCPTRAWPRPSSWRCGSTARCCSRARPASARPRWPRCSPAGPAAS